MAFKKGHKKILNSGKKKGVPNKVTLEIKEAYKQLIEKNTDNMIEWMGRIAEEDPARALEICIKMSDFVIPRLARSEDKVEHSVDDKLSQILRDIDGRTAGLPKPKVE